MNSQNRKLSNYEVEKQIEILKSESKMQEIFNFLTSDDTNFHWNTSWEDYLMRFIADHDRIYTKIDIKKEFLNLTYDFAKQSERTMAMVILDMIPYLVAAQQGFSTDNFEKLSEIRDEVNSYAVQHYEDWEEVSDSLDLFAEFLANGGIKEYFEIGMTLLSYPTPDDLYFDREENDHDEELKYLYSVGLYLLYEDFKAFET